MPNILPQNHLYAGSSGSGADLPRASVPADLPVAAELSNQMDTLSKTEEALRVALSRLRGSRPEASLAGVGGGSQSGPSISTRATMNGQSINRIHNMTIELMERLGE